MLAAMSAFSLLAVFTTGLVAGAVLALGLLLTALISALIVLPVLPADRIGDTPIADLNEDAVETVGWPA